MDLTFNYRQVKKSSAPLMLQLNLLSSWSINYSNIYRVTWCCQEEAEPFLDSCSVCDEKSSDPVTLIK